MPAIIREPFKAPNRPEGIEDESVDSFLTRRFGEWFAETFGSAMVHGIYAGDSRKLSVRAAFPSLWEAEMNSGGSLVRGMLNQKKAANAGKGYDLGDIEKEMKGVSVYSFKEGTSTITNALVNRLRENPNISLDTKVDVRNIRPGTNNITVGSFAISSFKR